MTDLIRGYRWATEDETEAHAVKPIPGAVLITLTTDSKGEPYTQGEAGLAVPDADAIPEQPFHEWPSNYDVDKPAAYDRCRRCGVARFSDDSETIIRATSACSEADRAVPGHIRTALGNEGLFCSREGLVTRGGRCPDGCDHADHYSNDGHPECEDATSLHIVIEEPARNVPDPHGTLDQIKASMTDRDEA